MANNSDDIRRLMNLVESIHQVSLIEGWVDNLKDRLDRRLGEKERAQMAAQLFKEYYTWLGHSNRSGDMEDLVRFMTKRVGFNGEDVKIVLDQSGLEYSGSLDEPASDATSDDEPEDDQESEEKDAEAGLTSVEDDGQIEAGEIKDDPRKYKNASGDWDRKKINDKLAKMPPGSKLTLGNSTFSRTTEPSKFYNESLDEARDPNALDRKTIRKVMDAVAAQVNDEYLYNGPQQDVASGNTRRTARAQTNGAAPAGNQSSTPNTPGKAASGQYDAAEMVKILKSDFQINNAKSWIDSLTRKVMAAPGVSSLSDNDMHDLALLGWALVRARN